MIGVHTPEFAFEQQPRQRPSRGAADEDRVSRSRSTTTTRSGVPSGTSTGPRSTSSMRADAFASITSARASTSSPRRPFSGCWRKPAPPAATRASCRSMPAAWKRRRTGRNLRSPENYVGYERTENFASRGGVERDRRRVYAAPARLALNQWALAGEWTMGRQATVLEQSQRPNRVSLSRARPSSRHGTAAARHLGAFPRVD